MPVLQLQVETSSFERFTYRLQSISSNSALHCGAGACTVGPFWQCLACALAICRVASGHRVVPGRRGGTFASALYMRSRFVESHRSALPESCPVVGPFSSALHVHSLFSRRVAAAYRVWSRHALASPCAVLQHMSYSCLPPPKKHCVELAGAAEGATTANFETRRIRAFGAKGKR